MKLITLLLTTFLSTFLSTSAYSDHHGNVPVGSGAFVALMVQAQDPDAYVETLKKTPHPSRPLVLILPAHASQKPAMITRGKCSFTMPLTQLRRRWLRPTNTTQ